MWWEIEAARGQKLRIFVGPSGSDIFHVIKRSPDRDIGDEVLALVHDVSELSQAAEALCRRYGPCTLIVDQRAVSRHYEWSHDSSADRDIGFCLRPPQGVIFIICSYKIVSI